MITKAQSILDLADDANMPNLDAVLQHVIESLGIANNIQSKHLVDRVGSKFYKILLKTPMSTEKMKKLGTPNQITELLTDSFVIENSEIGMIITYPDFDGGRTVTGFTVGLK